MKNGKFTMIMSILSIFILLLGATFSYFAAVATSENPMTVEAATVGGSVEVTTEYVGKALIPLDDNEVSLAYNDNNQCVDIYGYGACESYYIEVTNTGNAASYTGTIKFTLNNIENLKYLLLDEDDEEYVGATLAVSGTDQSLGDTFSLAAGESKTFRLIIWLSNQVGNQDSVDAGGSFSAAVTYNSSYGSRITGTFAGL